MALGLKLYITQDLNEGDLVRIDDITGDYTTENTGGYGAPNPNDSDVNKVRFLFSSYLTEQNAAEGVLECQANKEYEVVGSGEETVVVATQTYVLGDKFILMDDATPVIGEGLSLNETGRVAYTPDFLPVDFYTTFNPSAFGVNALTFPDSTYFAVYQVFTTLRSAGSTPAGTYIVTTGSISISGVVYNAGEVFTQGGTFSFTGNDIAEYNAEVDYAFPLYYEAFQARNEVALKYANSCNCDNGMTYKLMKIDNRFEAIKQNFENDINSDYSGTQVLLSEIIEIANQI